jgi:phosphate-selective porin OprO/OprP
MNLRKLSVAVALLAAPTGLNTVQAEDTTEIIKKMQQRIDDLEQKVSVLDRGQKLEPGPITVKVANVPTVSLGTDGLNFRSADTNFTLRLGVHLQADARFFPDTANAAGNHDTFLLRKVRPLIEGTVYDRFDYRLMLDFGSGITSATGNNGFVQDAYVNARIFRELQIRVGKFKPPVGLERLQNDVDVRFIERAFPTLLVPNRDVGVQIHGKLWDGVVNYAAGVFNGVPDGGSGDIETSDGGKEAAARVMVEPFRKTGIGPLKGLGVGVAGTFGTQQGALSSYVTPGQQRFFSYLSGAGTAAAPNVSASGDHWRLSPQAYYYWGPFGLLGEYVFSSQELSRVAGGAPTYATAKNSAWQVAATYFLTSEENSYGSITPRRPFSLGGAGWGAWELRARVSQLSVDDAVFPLLANPATSPSQATEFGIGLSWYLSRNVKFMLDYEQTGFRGGDANPLTSKGEKAVMGRLQLAF